MTDTRSEKLIDMLPKAKKGRFFELDFLRGFCVIMMMVDHFFFSASVILPQICAWFKKTFWVKLPQMADIYWDSAGRNAARYVVIFTFMFLCGISCTLSRSNLQRGLKAVLAAAVITTVTGLLSWFMGADLTIYFGVIHMLAFSMLIYWALSVVGTQIKKIGRGKKYGEFSDWAGRFFPAFVGLILLIVYFAAPWGHIGLLETKLGPEGNYPWLITDVAAGGGNAWKNFLSIFVDIDKGGIAALSADYFPLLPYAAIILIGSGFGELVYKNVKNYPQMFATLRKEPVSFVGRHGLLFYVGHQVVILAFFFFAGLVA